MAGPGGHRAALAVALPPLRRGPRATSPAASGGGRLAGARLLLGAVAKRERERRRAEREHVRDLERLAKLAPGGAPDRPLDIDTPPLVDVIAAATPCPLCGGGFRLDEHAAETIDGARLRVARVTCTSCGIARAIYFRLRERLLN